MDQNESSERKKETGSQTTIKAFGVEFSGPSWVAIVVVVVAAIGAAIYFSDPPGDDDTAQEAATTSADTGPAEATAPSEASTEQPTAAAAEQ